MGISDPASLRIREAQRALQRAMEEYTSTQPDVEPEELRSE